MYRILTAAGCAAVGCLIAQPAMAACSLSTQPIPVKIVAARPMIDVKVNGKSAHFLLDSATAVNMMSAKFAEAQKLAATKVSNASVVRAPQFEFAGASLKDVPFVTEQLPEADGVIGQTFLHQGDAEYDLGGAPGQATVKLAKAVGCESANMAYWAKEGDTFYEAALTPGAAPLTMIEVVVNGVKLRGLLSSGKPYTTITEKAAARAGVKTTDQGVKTLGSSPVKSWLATFNSVIVGNEETKSAPLEIDATADDFYDLLIGADFFTAHHLYVANSQQKIYFTKSSLPGAAVFKAHGPVSVGQIAGAHGDGRLQDHFSPGSSGGTTD